ncbi:hypothetical protein TWF173_010721 [Orbilia oligospora]|uniref:Uncharacterized protein n=1 Tax=Orbilia oligospora TaxID=2813651 RepID=A0A7C8RGY4_ORBOL|nr:hypothetical protein TWF970_003387 [Orbilia oligospora]KAF3309632.1 hypothetical protein TWF173_010721 [Orbilia oligospora]
MEFGPLTLAGTRWEIDRADFDEELPNLLKLIEDCDFIALDFEFSGVGSDPRRGQVDMNHKPTLAERYKELCESAEAYRIMQMGICPVKWEPNAPREPKYSSRPFNFFVAPHVEKRLFRYDRAYLFSASAIDFHLKNGFDFNKLFSRGCLYLGHQEEAHIKGLKRQRDEADKKEIEPKEEDLPMLEDVRSQIIGWIKRRESDPFDFLNIQRDAGYNGYQRRIISQFVRREFPDYNGIWYERHLQVVPYNGDRERNIVLKREDDFQKVLKVQRGVRHLIDKIMELKKPLIGHNLFTDLVYMHNMFIGDPPEDINDFRRFLQQSFGLIVDTKFLALHCKETNKNSASSSLPELGYRLSHMTYPHIDDFPVNTEQNHVAGYDAWCTARSFVKLSAILYFAGSDNPLPPAEIASCLDSRKEEIVAALATRPPKAGYGKIVEVELEDKRKVRIPHWSSHFWKVFGGRICVNGTVEGEFTL